MRIVLVPLDERPVNIDIPRQVAAIAGVILEIPEQSILPSMRASANLDELHEWILRKVGDQRTSHLVACVDTVVHGGLIPARISQDSIAATVERLEVFRSIKDINPELLVSAVSLIMRASDSYSAVEEPDYWSSYGRELHHFGAELHHAIEGELEGFLPDKTSEIKIPEAVLHDFELRRLRNHLVNLSSIALHEEGLIDTLAMTADDTAPHSAGSAEQLWLRHWCRALPCGKSILMYPGADEVGAVLVARALTSVAGTPLFSIACGEPDGLNRIPNFENTPLRDSFLRQISAAGGRMATPKERPDIVLVAHAPDPEKGDFGGDLPTSDSEASDRTISEIRKALAAGYAVALADVRFSNGGDPQLVDRLAEQGSLLQLSSYGGWNTAGNSIGSAVAHSIARWAGERLGTLDRTEADRALLVRILEDRAYQSGVRRDLHFEVFQGETGPVSPEVQSEACDRILTRLQEYLDWITRDWQSWSVKEVTLPWSRSFEIALRLEPNGDNF